MGWTLIPTLLLALSGCMDTITGDPPRAIGGGDNPGETTYWEGPITQVDGAPDYGFISGTGAMEATGSRTGFRIDVEAVSEATQFLWLVRSGSCSENGDPVAPLDTFNRFTSEDESFAEADVSVPAEGLYAMELHSSSGELLGCGNLFLQDD